MAMAVLKNPAELNKEAEDQHAEAKERAQNFQAQGAETQQTPTPETKPAPSPGETRQFGGVEDFGKWGDTWDLSAGQQQMKASGTYDKTSDYAKQFEGMEENISSRVDNEEGWRQLSIDGKLRDPKAYEELVNKWSAAGFDVRAIDMEKGKHSSNIAVRRSDLAGFQGTDQPKVRPGSGNPDDSEGPYTPPGTTPNQPGPPPVGQGLQAANDYRTDFSNYESSDYLRGQMDKDYLDSYNFTAGWGDKNIKEATEQVGGANRVKGLNDAVNKGIDYYRNRTDMYTLGLFGDIWNFKAPQWKAPSEPKEIETDYDTDTNW